MAGLSDDWEARRACMVKRMCVCVCMCKVQVGFAVGGLRTVAFPVTWWWDRRQKRKEGEERKGQGKKKEGGERRKKARAWGVGIGWGRGNRAGSREEGSRGRTQDGGKL